MANWGSKLHAATSQYGNNHMRTEEPGQQYYRLYPCLVGWYRKLEKSSFLLGIELPSFYLLEGIGVYRNKSSPIITNCLIIINNSANIFQLLSAGKITKKHQSQTQAFSEIIVDFRILSDASVFLSKFIPLFCAVICYCLLGRSD